MFFAFKKFNYKLTKESGLKILKRTILIFLVGLALNAFPFFNRDYSSLRIMGVLQRIALAYGIGGIICLSFRKKYLPYIGGGILLLYWFLLWFLGGSQAFSLERNVTIPIDTFILGANHLYHGFKGLAFDPEGLFSTISPIATVIFGYLIGSLIPENKNKTQLLKKMGIIGISTIAIALIWDIKKWASPFIHFGLNPLFIFVIAGIVPRLLGLIKLTNSTVNNIVFLSLTL